MDTKLEEKALESLKRPSAAAKLATVMVPRTVIYPVEVEYKPGVKTVEVRPFVIAQSFCSERQWERALEYEKQYPELQRVYRQALEANGHKVDHKTMTNPLNAIPIGEK